MDILQIRILNRSGQHLPFNSFSNLDAVGSETLIEFRPLALRNGVIGNVSSAAKVFSKVSDGAAFHGNHPFQISCVRH